MKRITRAVGIGTAAVAAIVVGSAGNAAAASQGVSCKVNGWTGTGATYYHTSSGYDYIDYWQYRFNGQAGSTKNNAFFYQYKDISGVDPEIYHQATADNKHNGVTYNSYPNDTIKISTSWKTYTTFVFSFDRNNDGDPECSDETYHW